MPSGTLLSGADSCAENASAPLAFTAHDRGLLAEHSRDKRADPAQHSWQVLAEFVATLQDAKAVRRFLRWERQQRKEAQAEAVAKSGSLAESFKQAAEHAAWGLVRRTQAHPRFADCYALPSYEKRWRRLERQPMDCSAAPVLFGLDCEMCETTGDTRALARVCVVDKAGRTVLQMLVKPKRRIVDYRTPVTGLSARDFEGLELRCADAQRAVAALLAVPGAVLVGHALHHDLHALRIDFQPIIDTSFLFSYKGLAACTPALADLCRIVLGCELRAAGAPHDCEADAAAAMALAQHLLDRGCPTLPPPPIKVPRDDLRKLMIHGLPPRTPEAALRALLPAGAPALEGLQAGLGEGGRRALLVFAQPGDANAAFQLLQARIQKGAQSADSSGRAQKTVCLPGGGSAKVRKMAAHGRLAFGRDAKPDRAYRKRKAADAAGVAEAKE